MNVQELNSRLRTLSDAHKQTSLLINRLAKLPGQHGSVSGSADARLELGAEIHERLKEQEESFELLRQEFEGQTTTRRKDSEKERGRSDLAARVTRLGENLSTARSQFRKAQLQAKRNAEASRRKEREALFTGLQEGTGRGSYTRRRVQENTSKEDQLLSATTDVTAALKQTYALMSQELSKSQFAKETLEESTAALQNLTENYSDIDTLLSSSRTLVSSLLHSQKSDTWYLESAFWLLIGTICWLVFRRVLYGPGWWLLYLPIRLIVKLMIFNTQVILSLFASIAGALDGAKQSDAIPQASERISTSLIVKPSATGGFPRFQPNMPAPSVAVGAGGSGAKASQSEHQAQTVDKSLLEQVDNMMEQSQQEQQTSSMTKENVGQATVLKERSSDEPPNPKKRTWEERPPEAFGKSQHRDEL